MFAGIVRTVSNEAIAIDFSAVPVLEEYPVRGIADEGISKEMALLAIGGSDSVSAVHYEGGSGDSGSFG